MNYKKKTPGLPVIMAAALGTCATAIPALADDFDGIENIVVTATREAKKIAEIADSISAISFGDLERIAPTHPAEALNTIPGVHVNNLGGEGHMSAIRHPITTSSVYLFLEDGVPTRPSGFFNHNGLYEINIPLSGRVEVIRGPGSALYGSDAVGGIINSITRSSPEDPELVLNVEVGAFGWKRGMLSGGMPLNERHGARLEVNYTDNEGYRDDTDYDRQSVTLRTDHSPSDRLQVKNLVTWTKVNQSGSSSLEFDDYMTDPSRNLFASDIAGREVDALRVSSEISWERDDENLLTFTPFYRDNTMALMPSWMMSYDPNIRETEFQSFGLLAKYRHNFRDKGTIIVGVDFDDTTSTTQEQQILPTLDGDVYVDYVLTGQTNYDYDADQRVTSPYAHFEWRTGEKIRWEFGLRYDLFDVSYVDNIASAPFDPRHRRPASQDVDFDQLSPKAGVVYTVNDDVNLYANYRHSFRSPPIGSMFRSGSSQDTDQLEAIEIDSFEAGLRGKWGPVRIEATAYHMVKKNDIVSFVEGYDRKVANAGETRHMGLELGLQAKITDEISFTGAWAINDHEYEDFEYIFTQYYPVFFRETRNFAGNKLGKAPRDIGTFRLNLTPSSAPALSFQIEWEHMGPYYTDETNTRQYNGHDLLNLRANYIIRDGLEVYARVMNLGDTTYSTYTSNQVGDPDISYRPGRPRTAYLGLRYWF